jgi:GT2 family glycosyltransferase
MSPRVPPDLAVIIVTYQRPSALFRLLESVMAQSIPRETYEVCVVDNGGDVPQGGQCVDHWVRPSENVGASAGRNLGVAATSAPLLLFLDDDGVVADGTFAAACGAFEQDPTLIAARGRVLPLKHPIYSSIASHYDRGLKSCDDWLVVEGMTAILRNAYREVGGYNPEMFGHEGIELSLRLAERYPEGRIRYLPDMVLRHDFVGSFAELWRKGRRMARAVGRAPCATVEKAQAAYRAKRFTYEKSATRRMLSGIPRTMFRWIVAYHKWRS